MKSSISLPTGLFWVFVWVGFMILYTFLDIAIWRKIFPAGRKYLNIVSVALCTAGYIFLLVRKNNFALHPFANLSGQGILLALGCMILFYFVLDLFLDPLLAKLFPSSEENYQEALIQLSKTPILTLLQICILAPVLEEILMRRFLLDGFCPRYGKTTALFLSTVLFALLHFNMVQTLSAFICGMILGLLYLKTNSLFCCILAHMGYNLLAYITTILPLCAKK
ncbi:MAG: CPBP family intramembrane metalloprotease [Lachnospiraceae bacterium]|nr:CPBP family intramembrane metalloprotease [Lachnospiraceae bacterium]